MIANQHEVTTLLVLKKAMLYFVPCGRGPAEDQRRNLVIR